MRSSLLVVTCLIGLWASDKEALGAPARQSSQILEDIVKTIQLALVPFQIGRRASRSVALIYRPLRASRA
jgi:hypothetical protein